MTARLFTASWTALWRYSQHESLPAVPVRTSNSLPKFWPQASAFPVCDELIPPKWIAFGNLEPSRAERSYRHQLHTIGVDRISARLDAIADERDGMALALCCFEDLSKPGMQCHRRWFANWMQEQTGLAVPEIGALAAKSGRAVAAVHEVDADKTPKGDRMAESPASSMENARRLPLAGFAGEGL